MLGRPGAMLHRVQDSADCWQQVETPVHALRSAQRQCYFAMPVEAHAGVRPLQVGGAVHALREGGLAVAGPVLKGWAGQCAGHWHRPLCAGAAAHVHHGGRAAAHAQGHAPAEGQERVRFAPPA